VLRRNVGDLVGREWGAAEPIPVTNAAKRPLFARLFWDGRISVFQQKRRIKSKDSSDLRMSVRRGLGGAFAALVIRVGRWAGPTFRRLPVEYLRNFFCIVCNRLGLILQSQHQLDVRFLSPKLA
jgi:hypothetical protein